MASCGSILRLEVYEPTLGVWVTVDTRSDGATITNEQVDITDKNGMPWRELANCGLRSSSITSSGVFYSSDDQIMGWLTKQAMEDPFIQARLKRGVLTTLVEGTYQIASFERTGEYNGAEEFSMTLESAGEAADGTIPLGDLDTANGMMVSTRLLTPNYTGPCCRVRRATDDVEQDIGFDGNGWRDDVAMASFLAGSDGFLVRWYHQGTFPGQDAVQTTASLQPLAAIAGVPIIDDDEGNPAFEGEGTARGTRMESENNIGDDDAKCIALVAQPEDPPGGNPNVEPNWICGQATGVQTHQTEFNKGIGDDEYHTEMKAQPNYVHEGGEVEDKTRSWSYASTGFDGGPWRAYLDGIFAPSKNAVTGALWWDDRQMRIFGGQFTNNTLLDGYLCEFICINGDYSDTTLAQEIGQNQTSAFSIDP